METMFTTNPGRAAYMKFLDYLSSNSAALGIPYVSMDNANVSPYTIRLHTKLVAGQNSYEFNFKNIPGLLSIEKTLADSDIFQGFGIALGIQRYNPASPDFSKPIWTYPDTTEFTTVAPGLELIYNGHSTLNTDGTDRIQKFDNHLFRCAPGGGGIYGPSYEERGYYLFPGYPIILGSKTNKFTVAVAQGDTTTVPIGGSGATSNNLVLLIHGFRFTGVNNGTGCNV